MDVGRLIREARWSAGMTQRALAAAAGVPVSQLCRYERARRSPRTEVLHRLLAACGKDVVATLVPYWEDLDAELRRRAARPLDVRLRDVGIRASSFFRSIRDADGDVVVGGGMAAVLQGLPADDPSGVLHLDDEPRTVRAVAAVLQRWDARVVQEGVRRSPWPYEPFVVDGSQWDVDLMGPCDVLVLRLHADGEPWPRTVRLTAGDQVLRVVEADELGDFVRAEVLSRRTT